jgi:hypothetical protein
MRESIPFYFISLYAAIFRKVNATINMKLPFSIHTFKLSISFNLCWQNRSVGAVCEVRKRKYDVLLVNRSKYKLISINWLQKKNRE